MVSAFTLFLAYVVGGLTFLPLCIAVFAGIIFYTSPVVHVPRKTGLPDLAAKTDDDAEPLTVYRAGWLTVRRTYEPLANPNDGTYVGMLASGYRSLLENRSRDPRKSKPKDRFFGVLKQNILFLYEGEDQAECWAAIEVSAHNVVIFPEQNVDGELFVKRTAIMLKPKKEVGAEKEPGTPSTPTGQATTEEATYDLETGKALPWFLFTKVNSDKEDWFHSLIQSSRLNSPTSSADLAADGALFSPEDMARLVESIDAQPDSIPMRWFNALLGRIFLAVNRTSSLEEYLTSRLVRKLKRVKLPSLLSEVKVREVNVGNSLPLFSKPMLKDLTADGDASMEVHVDFVGAVRITIETVATVSLGSRFKPYSVRLVLAVVLRELEGTLLVKVKRPPSNRLWFGFTQQPKMRIDVEPVVSARQIKWSLVTGPIESRIRELIAESLVLPHMDDLSFFSTLSEPLARGGIFGPFLRKEREVDTPASAAAAGANGADEDLVALGTGGDDAPTTSLDAPDAAEDEKTASLRRRKSNATLRSHDDLADSSTASTSPAPSIKSSTSVSSSLAGLGASFRDWRESKARTASSPGPGAAAAATGGEGSAPARKSSWFASTSAAARSSALSLGSAESRDASPAGPSRAGSTSSAPPAPVSEETEEAAKPAEEVSAARLREVLAERAESREREREEREREKQKQEREHQEQEQLDALAVPQSASSRVLKTPPATPAKSGLALTAPTKAGEAARDGEEKPLPSVVADEEGEAAGDEPLKLNDPASEEGPTPTASNDAAGQSEPAAPPALPPRTFSASPQPLPLNEIPSLPEGLSEPTLSTSASSSSSARPPSVNSASSASTSIPDSAITGRTSSVASRTEKPSAANSTPDPPATSAPPTPSAASKPPALPSRRPSYVKSASSLSLADAASPSTSAPSAPSSLHLPAPPPPPRRHTPSLSVDSPHLSSTSASSSAAGLLASWRTKASQASAGVDKDALAEGVKQARERLGRWGAAWSAKRAAGEEVQEEDEDEEKEDRKPAGGGGGYFAPPSPQLDRDAPHPSAAVPILPPRPSPGAGSNPGAPSTPERQRDRALSSSSSMSRAARSASLSLSSSPGGGAALGGHFAPPTASPSTQLSTVPAVAPTPSSPVPAAVRTQQPTATAGGAGAGGGMGGYKRASMMTLPGIRDKEKRERVREDHLGGGAAGAAASAVTGSTPAEGKEEAPTTG
ncbi:hypothetical protein JCM10207_007816 [Rhodosporidiobolus poonsookiae]